MDANVYIFAARYAHTRNTGAAHIVVNDILSNWHKIGGEIQFQLKKEAGEATCNFDDWQRLIDK